MTRPTTEQLVLARKIVAETIYGNVGWEHHAQEVLSGAWDNGDHVRSALAAIILKDNPDAV